MMSTNPLHVKATPQKATQQGSKMNGTHNGFAEKPSKKRKHRKLKCGEKPKRPHLEEHPETSLDSTLFGEWDEDAPKLKLTPSSSEVLEVLGINRIVPSTQSSTPLTYVVKRAKKVKLKKIRDTFVDTCSTEEESQLDFDKPCSTQEKTQLEFDDLCSTEEETQLDFSADSFFDSFSGENDDMELSSSFRSLCVGKQERVAEVKGKRKGVAEKRSVKVKETQSKQKEMKKGKKQEIVEQAANKVTDIEVEKGEKTEKKKTGSGETNAKYFDVNNEKIAILNEGKTVHFFGLFSLTVLHGEVEVLGYTVTEDSAPLSLYSPRGGALLYIRNTTNSDTIIEENLIKEFLPKLSLNSIKKNSAILRCKILKDYSLTFVEKHISQQILPKPELTFRYNFEPSGSFNCIHFNEEWSDILNSVTQFTKLLICGGKGVGKSTFVRYALNKLLMKFEKVQVIDVDPGQSEFCVPSCLSVHLIEHPVFGPNYTHIRTPEISLVSSIDVGHDPRRYIRTVKSLCCTLTTGYPTLINTMGFTKGIGIHILAAVIQYLQPTDVLQIQSSKENNNFEFSLGDSKALEKASKLFLPNIDRIPSFTLHHIMSQCDSTEGGWTALPRQLREMCMLAYFGKMMSSTSSSIFSTKLPMYEMILSEFEIVGSDGKKIHPAVVNANIVALCALQDGETDIFRCFGWGIIRGVDKIRNILVLLTPAGTEVLDKTTHLVHTDVTLPPSIYMTPDHSVGEIPYVMEIPFVNALGQIPKRSYLAAPK